MDILPVQISWEKRTGSVLEAPGLEGNVSVPPEKGWAFFSVPQHAEGLD